MDDTTPTPTRNDPERYVQLRRRAKRGLVAGYLHELSGRHNGAGPHEEEGAKDPIDLADGKGD
jgi:hypothetical protein